MNTLEVLEGARALISHPDNWCINVFRQSNGNGGTAYCALGAIQTVMGFHFHDLWAKQTFNIPVVVAIKQVMTEEEKSLAERNFGNLEICKHRADDYVSAFNNNSSHRQVIDLFDRAIAREKTMAQLKSVDANTEVTDKELVTV